jgi:hypothetical protein
VVRYIAGLSTLLLYLRRLSNGIYKSIAHCARDTCGSLHDSVEVLPSPLSTRYVTESDSIIAKFNLLKLVLGVGSAVLQERLTM